MPSSASASTRNATGRPLTTATRSDEGHQPRQRVTRGGRGRAARGVVDDRCERAVEVDQRRTECRRVVHERLELGGNGQRERRGGARHWCPGSRCSWRRRLPRAGSTGTLDSSLPDAVDRRSRPRRPRSRRGTGPGALAGAIEVGRLADVLPERLELVAELLGLALHAGRVVDLARDLTGLVRAWRLARYRGGRRRRCRRWPR